MRKHLCCLLALSLLLLGGCGSKYEKIEIEAVCPQTLQTQRSGELKLSVDTSARPGGVWECQQKWGDVTQVDVQERENRAVISINGLKEGSEDLSLYYLYEGEEPQYLLRAEMSISVSAEKVVTLLSYHCQDLGESGSGGEDTPVPCHWTTGQDGTTTVTIALGETSAQDWNLEGESGEIYETEGLIYGLEDAFFEIVPLAQGEATVVLKNETAEMEIPLRIIVSESRMVTIQLEGSNG